ncbi:hypothetical protein [Pedococcus sp. 2YAF34]|uniref:hypothetical protein n=1 Tax=Pedococcus sp. 2YAF34 TaxID=3233032 RepID=UPI003F94FC00
MSEELGVGFAVLLSERWMRGRVPGSPTFRTVDIDVALANRSIKAARARKSVEAVGAHRPDYILIGDHPSSRGRMRVAMLECKGTKSPRHSLTQLVRASHQLRGVAIAGRRPAGLAVSTIIGDSHITFNALQLLPDDDKPHSGPWAAGAPPTHADSDVEVVDVDVDRLGPDSPDTTIEPIAARGVEMAAIGLKSSFAFLADFSGDDEAFRRWAPGLVRAKLGRGAEDRRNRTEVTTADGTRYIGVRNRISLPGGDIHAFMGVRQDLDRALHSGDPSAVLDVQRSVHSTDMSPRREGVTESVEAIGTDGAALILTPV